MGLIIVMLIVIALIVGFVSTVLIKALFLLDALITFMGGFYLSHQYISSAIADNWAITFWDVIFGVIAVLIYGSILFIARAKFMIVWKVINAFFSFFNSAGIYQIVVELFINRNMLPLLKNGLANVILNLIFVIALAYYVYKRREQWFIEQEEKNSVDEYDVSSEDY